jgi:hypothetical protein
MGACDLDLMSPDNILIWEAGYYHIYYNVYHTEPCQFSVFLNNILVPSATVGSPTGSATNSLTMILYISPLDILYYVTTQSPIGTAAILNYRNYLSYSASVTLNGLLGSGSAVPQATAIATIFKLA